MTGERAVSAGDPAHMGLRCDARGGNVAVASVHAERIELCLFDEQGRETDRISLPERTGWIRHGHVAGLRPGQRYGFRAHGPWAPEAGHRFNPAKLLLDPYATAWDGPLVWHQALAGDSPEDSAPHMAKCIAEAPLPKVDPAERPGTPWSETVIYEAHAKGLTQLWPGLPPEIAGTVEALSHADILRHISRLGVTAVELLPIQGYIDESRLTAMGLANYWGYNTVGFFLPEPRRLGPSGRAGLREAVRRLHGAGIEVILDVAYNHTGEGDDAGPTLAFRGLDNASYYALDRAGKGGYANETGCGNRLDLGAPMTLRLVMDSLRWWVERMGIDGFRFDLAPALTRGSAFLSAVAQDPVLAEVKLIAEPWDIGEGGYRLGGFPAPWAEWNDAARDAVRGFWRGDSGAAGGVGEMLLGSAGRFDRAGRRAWSSVNYAACHDGQTLADITMYAERHNAANGEGNRDGHGDNRSDNFGVEGATDDPAIRAARLGRQKAMAAAALLAQGTPMLRAGDEVGQSQGGNNNAYCQDNAVSWIRWPDREGEGGDLETCIARCLALRRAFPVLRHPDFLHGEARPDGLAVSEWLGAGGGAPAWERPDLAFVVLILRGDAMPADPVALALNRGDADVRASLPPERAGPWRALLDTSREGGAPLPGFGMMVPPSSLCLFATREGP